MDADDRESCLADLQRQWPNASFSLDSEWQLRGFSLDQLEQQSRLLVEGLSGSYGEYRFEGVELAAAYVEAHR